MILFPNQEVKDEVQIIQYKEYIDAQARVELRADKSTAANQYWRMRKQLLTGVHKAFKRFASEAAVVEKDISTPSFIEEARFEPLGNPSSLLNVTLPASTVLNLRVNSIIAANGDLNNITSKLSVLKFLKPIIYNKVSSASPLSLIVANSNTSNSSFITLNLEKDDKWIVYNSKDLIGWYGAVDIHSSKLNGVEVEAIGKGNLILNGEGQVFTVKLNQGESIYLKPSSILGYSLVAEENSSFHKLKTSNLNLELPKLSWFHYFRSQWRALYSKTQNALKQVSASKAIENSTTEVDSKSVAKLPPQLEPQPLDQTTPVTQNPFSKVSDWLSTKFNNYYLLNKVFYEVNGPATILIQNSKGSNSQLFTHDQLSKIYKELK